jgi:multiple sugar transport system permease protein
MDRPKALRRQEAVQGILSVLPVMVVILLIRAYPIVVAVVKSFTNWDGLYNNAWVGLQNYTDILKTSQFYFLLRNNFILALHIPVQVFAGIVIAILLYEQVPGWRIFRNLSFLPQIISTVIIGYLFRIFFGFLGPINAVLRAVGLDFLAIEWLANAYTALLVINITLVWAGIGWQVLIILGGLSSINPSVFDAARIDGANYWQRLFKIVLPLLSRVIEYSFIVSVVWVFTGLFPFIYSMTAGGPGFETTTIDYMIYRKAFVAGTQLGAACAVAVILLVITLLLTRAQMAVANRAGDVE